MKKPTGEIVEMDAMDVAEWEHDQHTPLASDAKLAALVKQTATLPPAPAPPRKTSSHVARAQTADASLHRATPTSMPIAKPTPALPPPRVAAKPRTQQMPQVPAQAPMTLDAAAAAVAPPPVPDVRPATQPVAVVRPATPPVPVVRPATQPAIARAHTQPRQPAKPAPGAQTLSPVPVLRPAPPAAAAPAPGSPVLRASSVAEDIDHEWSQEPVMARAPTPAPLALPLPVMGRATATAAHTPTPVIAEPAPVLPPPPVFVAPPAPLPPAPVFVAPSAPAAPVFVAPPAPMDVAPSPVSPPLTGQAPLTVAPTLYPTAEAAWGPRVQPLAPPPAHDPSFAERSRRTDSLPALAATRSGRGLVILGAAAAVLVVVVVAVALMTGGSAPHPAAVALTEPARPPAAATAAPAAPEPAAAALPPAASDAATATGSATGSDSAAVPGAAAKPAAKPAVRRPARPGKKLVLDYDKPAAEQPAAAPSADAGLAKARAAYAAGNQRLFAGDPDGAIREYRQALALYPGYVAGYRGLGLAFAQQGDKPKALQALRTYVNAVPNAKDVGLIKKRIAGLSAR